MTSDQLASHVKEACAVRKLKGLKESQATATLAAELERLQKARRLADKLTKLESEFPARLADLKAKEAKLIRAIKAETEATEKRQQRILALHARQSLLLKQFEKVKQGVIIRNRNEEVSKLQREEIWTLILRVAEVIKGCQEHGGVVDLGATSSKAEEEVLTVLMRNNEERIVELQAQIEDIARSKSHTIRAKAID